MVTSADIVSLLRSQFQMRNDVFERFIPAHCLPLANTCQEMAWRFRRGGRLLAVGVGPYVSDAQHVSVEFVHPVIVGKRALPALDLSLYPNMLEVLAAPDDIVMGFAGPGGDATLSGLVARVAACGALVCRWPGQLGALELAAGSDDPFIHQELTELMYHTLWETVHVFFEQEGRGDDVGASAFLYPFLGQGDPSTEVTLTDVAASIELKAREDERLRDLFVAEEAEAFSATALAIQQRIESGGKLIAFGNGGSATDANDFVFDCLDGAGGKKPIPAISLSMEPAVTTAISNDVGVDLTFSRQLIAGGRPQDVAFAISTSGKSRNICTALEEARKRGMLTVALLGYDGGDVVRQRQADHALVVRSDYIPRIQEVQASIYHVLRLALDRSRSP